MLALLLSLAVVGPVSGADDERIERIVLRAERIRALAKERLRVVQIANAEEVKVEGPAPAGRTAEVFLASYRDGRGYRALVDVSGERLVALEQAPGRPQSSAAERRDATRVIWADRNLARLLREGGQLQGGFVVDPPKGAGPGRFLEYHLGDQSGRRLLREIVVDLSRRRIARMETPERHGSHGAAR